MRILHLITRMDGGGSAVNTLLSAQHQARAGHQVVLACGPSQFASLSAVEQQGVQSGIDLFRELGGRLEMVDELHRELGWHDFKALKEIKALVATGFDIVHTHTSKAGALGRKAVFSLPKAKRPKVVHTPHGHIFHGYFGSFKTWLFAQIEKKLARQTDVLIALTEAERDDHLALGIGKPEQWKVVPSGVDVERISNYIWDQTISENSKKWDAVCVGRLVPIKGMDRLLKAWAIVVKIKPQAKLALVGDGQERRELERLASRLNILPNVSFAGWADPLPYLASAKSFALMSHNEGMGRVVVEAMAASLPCVVANVCGLQELVDETVGACVNADDPHEVADALLRDWPRDVRVAARERSHQYSIAVMMQQLDAVYADLLTPAEVSTSE